MSERLLLEIPSTRNQWFTGNFQARLVLHNSTEITFEKTGAQQWINGIAQSEDWGPSCTTSDNLIDATGARIAATPPAANTFYYAYASSSGELALCATDPQSSRLGGRYLDATGVAASWLHVGYVKTDGTPNFVDDDAHRWVISWYERRAKRLYLTPGYNDNDANTSANVTANGFSTLDQAYYLSNGQDPAVFFGQMVTGGVLAAAAGVAVGVDGIGLFCGFLPSGAASGLPCCASGVLVQSEGEAQVNFMLNTSNVALSIVRDYKRTTLGTAADAAATYFVGYCMG